jgi:hypothetical protein
MALKVVPAGDERCDVHNHRRPQTYVCETCLKEFGVDAAQPAPARRRPLRVRARRAARRWRSRATPKVVVGGAIGLLILLAVVVTIVGSGGGGGSSGPSQSEVVSALKLVPDGTGSWATADGACTVISIELGPEVQAGSVGTNLVTEVTNEQGTVGAVVTQKNFSLTETQCADQVGAALKAHF